jgi:Fic family protein
MLFNTPELTEDELGVVARIDEMRRNLSHTLATPRRWTGLLRRATFARAIRASNTIEGYEVSPDDAIAAVEREEPLDAKTEAWAAVNCYRSAMTYVLSLAEAPRFSYSIDLLNSLHFMMLEYNLAKHPGRWRLGMIKVRDEVKGVDVYEGPPADSLPELMDELIESLNDSGGACPEIVRAAMGHLNLAMIHPFSDGNGRMARCLQSLILARTGSLSPVFSSIEEYLGRYTPDYYDVLLEVGKGTWQPQNDATPWIRFCLLAHYSQATTLERRVQELRLLWDVLEEELKRRKLPERMLYALADAAVGHHVRNATYRPAADITNQVASRDFKVLVREDLLVPVGEKRGRSYTRSATLQAMREKVRLPKVFDDPFTLVASAKKYLPGLEPKRLL